MVTVAGIGNSGSAVQVATVVAAPTVTSSTANLANNASTLTITGTNFSTTAANDTLTFSGAGSTGITGSVTSATATSLTYTFTHDPTSTGELDAVVTVSGASIGAPVQVANVVAAPTVTTQPTSHSVTALSNTTFTATATGTPTPTVQWYVNTGSGFTALSNAGVYSGVTTTTLTITGATGDMNGYQYEAVFSNGVSPNATTTAATLTVSKATPSVSSVNAVNLGYGTALANSQLSGTASVPGSFSYTTAAGARAFRRQRPERGRNLHADRRPRLQHGTVDRYGQRGPGDIDGHGRWPNEGLWR